MCKNLNLHISIHILPKTQTLLVLISQQYLRQNLYFFNDYKLNQHILLLFRIHTVDNTNISFTKLILDFPVD
jgi:hypothetical protein